MHFMNSYKCPQCKVPFPLIIRPSMRMNRGLLAPYLKCPNCGQVCQQRIDPLVAIWIWPITIGLFVSVVYLLQRVLYIRATLFYIFLVIVFLFPLMLGIRSGLKLEKIENYNIKLNINRAVILPLIGMAVFAFSYYYCSRDWLNIVLGIIIGFAVWGIYYYFSNINNNKRNGFIK